MRRLMRARRPMRAFGAAAAFLLLATPVAPPPLDGPPGPGTGRLFARAVPLNPDAPDQRMFGPMRYLDGWVLSSDDRHFGGISALAVDGPRLLALSDQGLLFRFAPPPGDGGVERIPLVEGPGRRGSKADRDSESLVLADGRLWVGYENSDEIWRYAAGSWAAEAQAAPAAMKDWAANRGPETLVRLADGRFLAIREGVDDEGVSDAVLFLGDPAEAATATVALRIDPPPGYRFTDGVQMPDGRLLLLARSFGLWSGWTARLMIAQLPARAEELMPVRELAAFEAPLTRDNMEALALSQEGGRTIVWIASDDNLFGLQRTLLLKFEWLG